MTSVSLYCRVSLDPTDDQASVQRQEKACRAWATERGLTVQQLYVDNSVSASKGKTRPAFERLLKDRPPVVVVWHLDRLLRKSSRDLERVLDLECTVHSLMGGDFDLSTPTGRALARTVVAWAQNEVELKGERQRSANRERALSGRQYGRKRQWGWHDLMCLEVDEEAAGHVLEAVARVLEGASCTEVAADWNARGIRPPQREQWTSETVRAVLLRPANAGIVTYKGEEHREVEAQWSPLFDPTTYDALRVELTGRAFSTQRGYKPRTTLLGGLAVCGKCGWKMQGSPVNGKPGYMCSGRTEGCYRTITAAVLDDFALRWTATAVFLADVEDYLPAVHALRLKDLDGELESITRDRAEVAALELSVASKAALLAPLDAAERSLRAEAAELTRDSAMASMLRDLTDLDDTGDVDEDSARTAERIRLIEARLRSLSLRQQRLLVAAFGTFTVAEPGGQRVKVEAPARG